MTSRLELILNAIIRTGEFYMQLKLLYKTHQALDLSPVAPLEMRCSVSIPESAVLIIRVLCLLLAQNINI